MVANSPLNSRTRGFLVLLWLLVNHFCAREAVTQRTQDPIVNVSHPPRLPKCRARRLLSPASRNSWRESPGRVRAAIREQPRGPRTEAPHSLQGSQRSRGPAPAIPLSWLLGPLPDISSSPLWLRRCKRKELRAGSRSLADLGGRAGDGGSA